MISTLLALRYSGKQKAPVGVKTLGVHAVSLAVTVAK